MPSYFVSGASSGLGAEMARQLVRRGDTVALSARRVERLQALAADLERDGGRVTIHPADVTDPDAVRRAVLEADQAHDGLDVVIANAGRAGGSRIGTGGGDANRSVIATNIGGTLAQAEIALELFRPRHAGHLVLVSSLAARRGLPGSAAVYSASKAAIASLGESLRIELDASGISVTTLLPGYIETDLSAGARFPYKTPLETGVKAMLDAIDSRVGAAVVPAWPWRPLGVVLRTIPARLIRRSR